MKMTDKRKLMLEGRNIQNLYESKGEYNEIPQMHVEPQCHCMCVIFGTQDNLLSNFGTQDKLVENLI